MRSANDSYLEIHDTELKNLGTSESAEHLRFLYVANPRSGIACTTHTCICAGTHIVCTVSQPVRIVEDRLCPTRSTQVSQGHISLIYLTNTPLAIFFIDVKDTTLAQPIQTADTQTLLPSKHIHNLDLALRPRMAPTVTDRISNTITTLEDATRYYNDVKDDKDFREVFHEAGRGLLLVGKALQTVNTQLGGRNLAGDTQSATNALEGCGTKAKMSEGIFTAVAQAPETSRFKSYKAAVEREGKGSMVEVLVEGMMNDVCALAEKGAIKGMEDQVKGLRDAAKMLSEMESSVPEGGSGDTYTVSGSGNMNISKGSGRHFPGATFSGSVTFH